MTVSEVEYVCVVGHKTRIVQPSLNPTVRSRTRVNVVWGNGVVVIVGVENPREAHLSQIVDAFDVLGLFFGSRERGQQHARENCDDRDDDQKLNERECV